MVLSFDASMPLPAIGWVVPEGSSVSGQTLVQPLSSVQVRVPPFSEVSMYRVSPFPFTSTVPIPGTLAAATVMAALDAPEAEVCDEEDDERPRAAEPEPAEPQAARTSIPAAPKARRRGAERRCDA